jgi:hypothetical protein
LGKLEDRLSRLERSLLEPAEKSPLMENFERRVRVCNLYTAWRMGGTEKPVLDDARDQHWWAYIEKIDEVIDEMAVEGLLGLYAK